MAEQKTGLRDSLVHWVGWVLLSAVAIVDMISFREALKSILNLIQQNIIEKKGGDVNKIDLGFTIQTVDLGMLVVGSLVTLTLVVWFEYYLRQGLKTGQVLKRFLRILGIEAAIFIVVTLVTTLV